MHDRDTVAEALRLRNEEGLGARRVAKTLHLSLGTVRDWHAGRLPRHSQGPQYGKHPPELCSTCGGFEHQPDELGPAYVHLLGLYLGDGSISTHPRGVYRLRAFLAMLLSSTWSGSQAHAADLPRRLAANPGGAMARSATQGTDPVRWLSLYQHRSRRLEASPLCLHQRLHRHHQHLLPATASACTGQPHSRSANRRRCRSMSRARPMWRSSTNSSGRSADAPAAASGPRESMRSGWLLGCRPLLRTGRSGGDLRDEVRPQRSGQVVAHALEDAQAGAGNCTGGGTAGDGADQRVAAPV